MDKLVVDASAWLEYLDGSTKGEGIRKRFEKAQLYTPAICLAEIIARMIRRGFSPEIAKIAVPARSTVVAIDGNIGITGGTLYAELRKERPKIALSDALTLAIARKLGAKVLTCDNDFRGIPEAVVV